MLWLSVTGVTETQDSLTTAAQLVPYAGYTLKEAVKAKTTNYGGTCRPAHRPIPLAFSICGDCSTSVNSMVKGLSEVRMQMDKGCVLAEGVGKLAIHKVC